MFFRGGALKPMPPGVSKNEGVRVLDIHENDAIDERQFASWLKQAKKMDGWMA